MPAKEGVARNLTRTDGVAERSPSWSPDGRWIAYFSDKTGEYELYVSQSDGRGETRQLTKDGNCFRFNPTWSPDSKHIVFTDKTGAIYLHTIGGETKLIDTDPYAQQSGISWSHESQWIAYEVQSNTKNPTSVVYIYNVPEGQRYQLTNGFFNSGSPVFDREGKFLYFVSSRAFDDPEYEDVGTTFVYNETEVILAVPLRDDVELPMQPKNDEEEWEDEDDDSKDKKGEKKSKDAEEDGDADSDKEDSDDEDEDEDSDGKKEDGEEGDEEEKDALSGTWSLELKGDEIPPDQRNAVMMLELAEDGSVSGSVDTPGGEEDIESATFDEETGELKFEIESEGVGKIRVTATVKDGKMTGTVSMGGQEVEFTGERNEDDSKDGKKGKKKSDEPFKIDFENIARRIFQLPIEKGNFGDLAVNHKNQLVYARVGGGASIKLFDMHEEDDEPEEKTIVSGTPNYALTADGKKMLVFREESGYVVSPSPGQKLDEKIPTGGMKVMISPREEWKQVFTDAWRIQRDFFYDPNMHGVDWKAMHDHYANMLKDCSSRADVGFVIGELISELNVGHAYYRPGDDDEDRPDPNRVGLLGCTFEPKEDRYTIGTIFEGAEWDTDARNPLRTAGVKEGEYLLAINDRELTTVDNPYEALQGTVGMPTVLTISEDAKLDDDDRRVVIKPRRNDTNLRFRHWIESRRKIVDKKSDGKIGYVYVVNTGVPGQNDLFRQYYGQLSKEAMIIDDRWNGGGQIPTRFIELMNRPVTNYWAKRDGRDWTWPPDAHHGPKCMLTNGMAGSGGDMFPALFKQAGLGKLIGMRTWGGLVGISGNPQMIDGSAVTAPTFAFYEKDGTWGIEGHGVDPDIVVIDDPAEMVDGGDPQLNVAILHLQEQLKSKAYKAPARPKYPNRSRFGIAPEDK